MYSKTINCVLESNIIKIFIALCVIDVDYYRRIKSDIFIL